MPSDRKKLQKRKATSSERPIDINQGLSLEEPSALNIFNVALESELQVNSDLDISFIDLASSPLLSHSLEKKVEPSLSSEASIESSSILYHLSSSSECDNDDSCNFDNYSQERLENLVESYGLKISDVPTMKEQLHKLASYNPCSSKTFKSRLPNSINNAETDSICNLKLLHENITGFIKADEGLYHSILKYEPLDITPFMSALKSKNIKCSIPELKDFLDSQVN
ncbi:hypothetical protein DSO57_1008581 [Entomophthora muscae]|uniref:Uncharacterized protein n=1 Tax=Entomophthora muscae TaxID=34485 RepID=A0ACC2RLW2_9FUNG|nr:hypothetical protein DSO57_1008581 [Entomophthora muscae]